MGDRLGHHPRGPGHGLGLILSEPEEQSGLTALQTVEEKFQALGSAKGGPEFLQTLRDLRTSLDNTNLAIAADQAQAGAPRAPRPR